MSTRIGRVAIKPVGAWVSGQTYNSLDLVTHNGKGYISKVDANTVEPNSSASEWMLTLNALAVDSELTDTSDNPVSGNAIKAYVDAVDTKVTTADGKAVAAQNTADAADTKANTNRGLIDALTSRLDNIIDGNEVSF